MNAAYRSLGTLRRHVAAIDWPIDFFAPDDLPAFLDRIYVLDYQLTTSTSTARVWLAFEGELSLAIPGVDGVKVVFGGGDVEGLTFVTASLAFGSPTTLTLENIRLSLRFPPDVLKPASLDGTPPAAQFAEIRVEGFVSIDSNFHVAITGFDAFELTPVMIADSGVIIAASDVKLDFSRTEALPEVLAAGFDESFLGVYIGQATVKLPEGLPALVPADLVLKNAVIGTGGVSGRLEAHYTPVFQATTNTFSGNGAGELFGIPFGLQDVAVEFRQNALVESSLTGMLVLPFFDTPVAVELSIGLEGGFKVALSAVQPAGAAYAAGLVTLIKPGLLSITLDSIGFAIDDGVFTARLSGTLTPLFGGLNWPGFVVKELSIDSKGHVRLEGGWINLPSQYSLDFHGFALEITKLGFGKTDDGGKWIGFSGALSLVDSFPAGASVEGLRLTWYDDGSKKITLGGVGVEFEIPEVLRFKGEVSYSGPVQVQVAGGTETVERFDGSILLKFTALDLTISATLVVGSASGVRGSYRFFAIYVDVQLPSGIPLASTGVAFYGFAGLFALSMEPNKGALPNSFHPTSSVDEEWYEGWYKRAPAPGVTQLKTKWDPAPGSLAFGAGCTIGTMSDNGYAFNGKLLLVVVLPGPIILLEGKANLLKKRTELDAGEPLFRSLAVLDGRAGELLIGLDARYKYGKQGELVDIAGGMEAYYNFHDPLAWHLYLGEREPRAKRIQATIFKLFNANAYLMIDARRLQTGAWIGYVKHLNVGPLKLGIEAFMEANAVLNWKPAHLFAEVWLHGAMEARVFKFGFSPVAGDNTYRYRLSTQTHLVTVGLAYKF